MPRLAARADMFALLSFFWAVAVCAHQGYSGEIVRPTPSLLLTLVGTALLVRPSSVALLLCVVLGQFLDIALHLPRVAGHWLLFAVAGLWLLLGAGLLALKTKQLPSPAELYARCAPGLCLLLLIGYFIATLAKVHAVFFDPGLRGGAAAGRWLFGELGLGPPSDALGTAAAYATIPIEAAILVLLLLRRTRVLGLVIGCVFHIAVGTLGSYDFSAVFLALYVPMLGEDFAPRLRAVLARVPSAARGFALWLRVAHARATLPALLLLGLALAFVPGLLGLDAELVAKVCRQTYRVLWMDPASLLLTMLLAVWWFERPGSRPATANATTEPG